MKGQSFRKRFGFALHGLKLAVRRERSLRTQLLAAVAMLTLLTVARASPLWWAIIALTTGLVLIAELLNSALETLIDRIHPAEHPEIGAAKDIAAGAVLVASVASFIVGLAFVLDWLDL